MLRQHREIWIAFTDTVCEHLLARRQENLTKPSVVGKSRVGSVEQVLVLLRVPIILNTLPVELLGYFPVYAKFLSPFFGFFANFETNLTLKRPPSSLEGLHEPFHRHAHHSIKNEVEPSEVTEKTSSSFSL